jgi:hypothetical protein
MMLVKRLGGVCNRDSKEEMAVQEGSKVLFSRAGRVLEGRVFAVHGGACSVEVTTRRAFYLERWEILLDMGVDHDYLAWLLDDEREFVEIHA